MSSDQDRSLEELKRLNKQFDQQLSEFKKSKSRKQTTSWKRFFVKFLLLIMGLFLPFIILVRTSVYFYQDYQANGWLALGIGCSATVLLLMVYGGTFIYRFGIGKRAFRLFSQGILVLVVAYAFYGMMYYSSLNTKTDEIHSYYRSLHPIIRVALTTVTLANSDMIVTDIQRVPEDYDRMGLPENEQSLHYVQSSGYVHAVDLRTKGRAEWQNNILRLTFRMLGLSTIRHYGTADHLHVYLSVHK
ncbi:hypothetical protein [Fodinibius sp. Rm-B-1B1-1]|uniref:hypothetical protein n=1 Tax=Fodinibius alkaliphilus TaxID=3140241 RepID=UPI00315A3523